MYVSCQIKPNSDALFKSEVKKSLATHYLNAMDPNRPSTSANM